MSEFELIRRFFARAPARGKGTLQGIGDDCARVAVAEGMELAVTTDLLIEGRHFSRGADARKLGHKALAVNLSDLAACGAAPRWITLALALPAADEAWLAAFAAGLFALAERHEVELVGGDTTRGPLAIDITALGEVPAGKALSRTGAKAGDDIWVSGALGGAALALARPGTEPAQVRLHEPEPRVALGTKLRGIASAAIDVSDGLAGDLAHVLERSGVGALVRYASIPKDPSFRALQDPDLERKCVLSGGDDYELLFTAPKEHRAALEALASDVPVSCIGEIVAGAELRVLDEAGKPMPHEGGFDHFA